MSAIVDTIAAHAREHPLLAALAGLVLWITFKIVVSLISPSPFAKIPTAKRESWIVGNRMAESEGLIVTEKDGSTRRVYGPGAVFRYYYQQLGSSVYRFPEPFGGETLNIADPHAIAHILADTETFQSHELRSEMIKFIVGDGIVSQYGDPHRKMRRLMGPSFSVDHLREMTGPFLEYGELLCIKLAEDVDRHASEATADGAPVDISYWLDSVMLDIIGATGFGYEFYALKNGRDSSVLSAAFNETNQAAIDFGGLRALHMAFSGLLYPKSAKWPISDGNRRTARVNKVINEIAMEIVQRKRKEVQQEMNLVGTADEVLSGKKDLLTLLIRSNLNTSAADRLTDKQIAGQIQTFLFAGYETSAVTLSFALYFLAMNPKTQTKLRDSLRAAVLERKGCELSDLQHDTLSYDDIWADEFKYLHDVVNETLRLCLPVPASDRQSKADAVVPLMDPVPTLDGRTINRIHIPAGATINLNLRTVNYRADLFGDNPEDFVPERWDNLPELHSKAKLPPYGLLTFSGGPKSCIGSRFSLTEMKALLILLLRDFEFRPLEKVQVRPKQALVVRPRYEDEHGHSAAGMPLRVRRIR